MWRVGKRQEMWMCMFSSCVYMCVYASILELVLFSPIKIFIDLLNLTFLSHEAQL